MNSDTITLTLPTLTFTQLDELAARVPITVRAFPSPEGTELRATLNTHDVLRLLAVIHRLTAGGF